MIPLLIAKVLGHKHTNPRRLPSFATLVIAALWGFDLAQQLSVFSNDQLTRLIYRIAAQITGAAPSTQWQCFLAHGTTVMQRFCSQSPSVEYYGPDNQLNVKISRDAQCVSMYKDSCFG